MGERQVCQAARRLPMWNRLQGSQGACPSSHRSTCRLRPDALPLALAGQLWAAGNSSSSLASPVPQYASPCILL